MGKNKELWNPNIKIKNKNESELNWETKHYDWEMQPGKHIKHRLDQ